MFATLVRLKRKSERTDFSKCFCIIQRIANSQDMSTENLILGDVVPFVIPVCFCNGKYLIDRYSYLISETEEEKMNYRMDARMESHRNVTSREMDMHSASERRIRNNKLRRKREIRKNFMLTVLTVCFAATFAFSANVILSSAKDQNTPVSYKYYGSIVVENGDSLWSIAKEHMGTQYESERDYVKEVMQMNSLTGDKIVAGQHLVIPYYSTEFVN